jgi:hypothetical protein
MIKSHLERPSKEIGDPKKQNSPALSNGLSIADNQEQEIPAHPVAKVASPKLANSEPVKKLRFISTCYDTKLLWSQTKEHIRIKILLVGVSDYYLKITPYYADFA